MHFHRSSPLTSRQAKGLAEVLDNADTFARLAAHARCLSGLQRDYAGDAPRWLTQASRVINFKNGVVVIRADSSAVAAKLRQLVPSLTAKLVKFGWQVTGLEIRVQPDRENYHNFRTMESRLGILPSGTRSVSQAARQGIEKLSESLSEASPLKRALEEFLKNCG